jgi:hypothetical protein
MLTSRFVPLATLLHSTYYYTHEKIRVTLSVAKFKESAMKEIPVANDDPNFDFEKVPDDFPRPSVGGAVSGHQSKLLLVEYDGKYYEPGCTPPELFSRWDICEDLAVQFVAKCRRNQTGKYSHLSETEILDQYCERLLKTNWGSDAELRWVIRRTAQLLGWPAPAAAMTGTHR